MAKKCTCPALIVEMGDEISLKKKAYENTLVQATIKEPTLDLPHFLKLEPKEGIQVGTLIEMPLLSDIPFEFEPQYFIEFYGKTK